MRAEADKGFSLIKMVIGLAVFCFAAMTFASWMLEPGREQAVVREKMRRAPDSIQFATDLLKACQTTDVLQTYDGLVVEVTGIIVSKSTTTKGCVIYLGPEVDARTVDAHFDEWPLGVLDAGRVLTVRGVAETDMGNIWLNGCVVWDNMGMKNQLVEAARAKQKAIDDAQQPKTMSIREISRIRRQRIWDRANRPRNRNNPSQ